MTNLESTISVHSNNNTNYVTSFYYATTVILTYHI